MPSYDLKLYNYVDRSSTMSKGRGEFQFEAANDLDAILRTRNFYAKYLTEYDYALLSDTRARRFVWEQDSATRSAESGRSAE